jgi:predicted flavoprotein YhiN
MNENIKAGADIHAGDGGYSEGTQEKYDEFVKTRNQSLAKMRIRELWDQAVQPHTGDSWAEQTAFMERFAKLIVQGCVMILDEDDGATHHRELLFTHFGVEE